MRCRASSPGLLRHRRALLWPRETQEQKPLLQPAAPLSPRPGAGFIFFSRSRCSLLKRTLGQVDFHLMSRQLTPKYSAYVRAAAGSLRSGKRAGPTQKCCCRLEMALHLLIHPAEFAGSRAGPARGAGVRTRRKVLKLCQGMCRSDIGKKFF